MTRQQRLLLLTLTLLLVTIIIMLSSIATQLHQVRDDPLPMAGEQPSARVSVTITNPSTTTSDDPSEEVPT